MIIIFESKRPACCFNSSFEGTGCCFDNLPVQRFVGRLTAGSGVNTCLDQSKINDQKLQDSNRISCTIRSCPQGLEDVKILYTFAAFLQESDLDQLSLINKVAQESAVRAEPGIEA
jgi:hypothetical protein